MQHVAYKYSRTRNNHTFINRAVKKKCKYAATKKKAILSIVFIITCLFKVIDLTIL